ncbi:MAG: hypothetical protein U0821_18105 [Chloroflexota bacterium]
MSRAGLLLPVPAYALCSLILFREGLAGASFYERDTFLFYEPLTRWFAEQLRGGSLPLWMPLMFGGYPLFADGEIGMLYPLNLLVLPLASPTYATIVLRWVHLVLAASFMWAFLRVLGIGGFGPFVGGLTFGYGSFLVAQLHHENVVRSAIWLPLVLLCLERAFQVTGWSRQRWLALGGLALAMAALGLHIQAVAMTLLALALFTTVRLALGPVPGPPAERLLLLVWAPGLVAAIGAAASAVQWLPLLELGRMSYRGPGLGYDLASTWPLRWQNLATVAFPYIFRMEDGRYAMLWQQWESFLYVGMAPLGLAGLGLLFTRRRTAVYFGLLAILALFVGLADQSPLNLHEALWKLPGFSSLRAPGRYAYLVVFGLAGLAALGAEWALHRAKTLGAIAGGGLLMVGAVALWWLVFGFRSRLVADPVRWKQLIDERYIAVPHEHGWLNGPMFYDFLTRAVDPWRAEVLWSVGLLAIAGVTLIARPLWPGRAMTSGLLLLLLTAVDLLSFGRQFHPIGSIDALVAPSSVTTTVAATARGARVLPDASLTQTGGVLEPNRLLYGGASTVSGYSSLETQRHFELWSNVARDKNATLNLWGIQYLVMADPPTDVVVLDGVAYRPYSALFNGTLGNLNGRVAFRAPGETFSQVRVLATLIDGAEIGDGAVALRIALVDPSGGRQVVDVAVGTDVAENAYDRPDVRPYVRHARPPVVATVPDFDPAGLPARANVYEAVLPLGSSPVARVELEQVAPKGQTRVFGLGLVRADGTVHSLFTRDREDLEPVTRVDGLLVARNHGAFPRAYVVPQAIERRARNELSALATLTARPFDASGQAIIEEGPPVDGAPPAPGRVAGATRTAPERAATVDDLGTDRVRIHVPDGPGGLLVLLDAYHRGWRATLDGAPAHTYIANFLFRGVRVGPGSHTVEWTFDPLSLRLGTALTAAAAALVLFTLLPRRRAPAVVSPHAPSV